MFPKNLTNIWMYKFESTHSYITTIFAYTSDKCQAQSKLNQNTRLTNAIYSPSDIAVSKFFFSIFTYNIKQTRILICAESPIGFEF